LDFIGHFKEAVSDILTDLFLEEQSSKQKFSEDKSIWKNKKKRY
jgi:hypothetical protein